jgi:RNA polymerase sigma-70 factor (ECF subfamily)
MLERLRSGGVRNASRPPPRFEVASRHDSGGFVPAVDARWFDASGVWSTPPEHWTDEVEERVGAVALRAQILSVLAQMPARQRAVVMLRDVDGLRGDEICVVLGLTPANERMLLHRGRSLLRRALDDTLTRETE